MLPNPMLKARAQVSCMFVPLFAGSGMPNVPAISSYITEINNVAMGVFVLMKGKPKHLVCSHVHGDIV